jgi:hypothetical protein
MRRLLSAPLWAAALAGGLVMPPARAQNPYANPVGPGGYRPPTYSPYLNLLRPGNPAANYYGLVRPQVTFANAIQGLQREITATAAQVAAGDQTDPGLPTTGHTTSFLNYSHYFSLGGGGGTTRPAPAGRRQATPSRTGAGRGAPGR